MHLWPAPAEFRFVGPAAALFEGAGDDGLELSNYSSRLTLKRLLDLIGMSVGGWLGWAAGALISLFTAFVVSVVGMGVGLYAVRRLTKDLP